MKNRIADHLPQGLQSQGQGSNEDDKANKVTDIALRQFDAARHSAENFVASHPAICLGAAVLTGVAVGWLVKRK